MLITGTTGRTPISSDSAAVIRNPPATPTVPWMVEVISAAAAMATRVPVPNSLAIATNASMISHPLRQGRDQKKAASEEAAEAFRWDSGPARVREGWKPLPIWIRVAP